MADNLRNRDPQYRAQVNVNEKWEVKWWCITWLVATSATFLIACKFDERTAKVAQTESGSQGADPEVAVQEPRDDYSQFSPGLRALLEDVRDGRLNEEPFVNHGYAKLGWQGNPPDRYRDESITDPERLVLGLAIEEVLGRLPNSVRNGIRNRVTHHAFDESNPREQSRAVAPGWPYTPEGIEATQHGEAPLLAVPPEGIEATQHGEVPLLAVPPVQCGGQPLKLALIGDFSCRHLTANFEIWYNLDGDRPVNDYDGPVTDFREGFADDGIPNYIQRLAVSFEMALDTYTALGYRRPNSDKILVLLGPRGAKEGDGFTPPTDIIGRSTIFLGHRADEWSIARHEVFHVMQYAYKPPRSIANIPGNLIPLQAWMESTAEWAAHQAVKDDPYMPKTGRRYAYANNLPDFLGRPAEAITRWDGFARGRQYGGFFFAEFLEERFGPDVIRKIWERIDTSVDADPGIMISDTVGDLGSNIIQEMITYGIAAYQLCGVVRGGPAPGVWQMTDPDIQEWCKILDKDSRTAGADPFPNMPRPARDVRQLSGDGRASGTIVLEEGGSAYVDLAVPGPSMGGGTKTWLVNIKSTVEAQVGNVQITPILWSEFPARATQDQGQTPIPDSDLTFAMGPCAAQVQAVTLVFTHFRPDLVDFREPNARIHWETSFVGVKSAGITNGTVALGVSDLGTLHEQGCTASSGEKTTFIGLRYISKTRQGVDEAEGLAHVDQNEECKCEGWGLRVSYPGGVPPYTGWARGPWFSGSAIPATRVVPVSFESTDTTAKSVVRLENGFAVTVIEQEFSPSPVPELFQVRVTVRTSGTDGEVPSVSLRRVLNWNAEPTPRQEFVTVRAGDPQVEYSSDDGLASADPAAGRTKIREDGEFTDAGPYDQGALFDLTVPVAFDPVEGNIGRVTLYYGAAADQSSALSAFAALGIRTWSIAKPVPSGDPGTPNTFMFGFKP